MPVVRVRSGIIAYEEYGEGTPLVVLHANAGNHHDFDSIIPALAVHYRIIAPDWPGFGDSEIAVSPDEASAMLLADALEDFVVRLPLERAMFLGNSVGGYAAARLALTQPERVSALILVDSGGFTAHNPMTHLFCQMKGNEWFTRRFDGQFVKWYLKQRNPYVDNIITRTDHYRLSPLKVAINAALWRSFTHPNHDLRRQAARIQAPTLLVWGRRDPVLRLADGKTAASLIPNARLEVLDTGHMPFAEDRDAFLAIIEPFLEQVVSSSHVQHHA